MDEDILSRILTKERLEGEGKKLIFIEVCNIGFSGPNTRKLNIILTMLGTGAECDSFSTAQGLPVWAVNHNYNIVIM